MIMNDQQYILVLSILFNIVLFLLKKIWPIYSTNNLENVFVEIVETHVDHLEALEMCISNVIQKAL